MTINVPDRACFDNRAFTFFKLLLNSYSIHIQSTLSHRQLTLDPLKYLLCDNLKKRKKVNTSRSNITSILEIIFTFFFQIVVSFSLCQSTVHCLWNSTNKKQSTCEIEVILNTVDEVKYQFRKTIFTFRLPNSTNKNNQH
jgi:hypothetical protein